MDLRVYTGIHAGRPTLRQLAEHTHARKIRVPRVSGEIARARLASYLLTPGDA